MAQQIDVAEAIECLAPVKDVQKDLEEFEASYDELKNETEQIELLQQRIVQMRHVIVETQRLSALGSALNKLKEPPQFDDPVSISRIVEQIREQQKTIQRSKSIQAALKPLVAAPVLGDERALRSILNDVDQAHSDMRQLKGKMELLAGVTPPPALTDLQTIAAVSNHIVELKKAMASHAQAVDLAAAVGKQLAEVESDIEQWVIDNPSCPTCGNEINAAVMLGGGGHQHG